MLSGAAAVAGASGGDGYDAFTTSDYVLNVWHHSDYWFNMDCHVKATGDSCGSVYSVEGHPSSMGSTGDVVGNKVYSVVGDYNSYPYSFGVLCNRHLGAAIQFMRLYRASAD